MAKIAELLHLNEAQLQALIRAKKYQRQLEAVESRIRGIHAELRQQEQERDRLEKKIQRITRQATSKIPRNRRTDSLADTIIATLTKSGPLGLTELTHAILKGSKYHTTSTFQNFRTTVAHTLRHIKNQLMKSEEGYTVKKAATKTEPKTIKKGNATRKSSPKRAAKKTRKTALVSKKSPKAKREVTVAQVSKPEPAQVTAPA